MMSRLSSHMKCCPVPQAGEAGGPLQADGAPCTALHLRLLALLLRYKSMSGHGYQAALPPAVFDVLHRRCARWEGSWRSAMFCRPVRGPYVVLYSYGIHRFLVAIPTPLVLAQPGLDEFNVTVLLVSSPTVKFWGFRNDTCC